MKKILLLLLFLSIQYTLYVSSAFSVNYTQDANCVGAWLFTEGSGTTVADSSANTNTGNFKANGEPAWSGMSGTGAPAYADYKVTFDGSDDYINCGIGLDQTTNDFSLVAWSMYTTPYNAYLFANRESTSPYSGYFFRYTSTSSYRFLVQLNDQSNYHTYSCGTNLITGDVWHHVAVTIDRVNSDLDTYVDGVLDTDNYDISATSGSISSSADMLLGRDALDGVTTTGSMSESAVFSDLLSSTEINDIMDNGLVGATVTASPMYPRMMWVS